MFRSTSRPPVSVDAWDQRHCSRCFVTIANSAQWMAITGEKPPVEPATAADYTRAGLPWFDYYGGDAKAVEEVVTAPRSPWQNPFVERVIGSIRRECLDHVIVLNERHLRRILASYADYYHGSRTHLSSGKGHALRPADPVG